MPVSAPRPCSHAGCNELTLNGRCDAHKRLDTGTFGDSRRGTRHQRGYGTAWDRQRLRILRRDSGLCQVCLAQGIVQAGNEVDHKVPKAGGGTEDDDNLQAICRACHRAKTQAEARRARGLASEA